MICFDDASIREKWTPAPPIGRGKPGLYSETATQTFLKIKGLLQLPYRATEGLIKSMTRLCHLNLPVPDHTHLSRRVGELSLLKIPRQGLTHVVVDSTSHSTRSKARLAKYRPMALTTASAAKRRALPSRRATVQSRGETTTRDPILQELGAKGLAGWKNDGGYHRRNIAENMMFRLKQLGDCLYSRTFERQATETHVRAAILNTFTYLGMTRSDRIGQIASAA